mmetsp:Transcript_8350/g.13536  ORF Transcript_8350/g.13536 Transcript_8350/m.13536 type:complete len:210 (-) Transcript_8350:825-1454(-)
MSTGKASLALVSARSLPSSVRPNKTEVTPCTQRKCKNPLLTAASTTRSQHCFVTRKCGQAVCTASIRCCLLWELPRCSVRAIVCNRATSSRCRSCTRGPRQGPAQHTSQRPQRTPWRPVPASDGSCAQKPGVPTEGDGWLLTSPSGVHGSSPRYSSSCSRRQNLRSRQYWSARCRRTRLRWRPAPGIGSFPRIAFSLLLRSRGVKNMMQ